MTGITSWSAGVILGKTAQQVQRGVSKVCAFLATETKKLLSVQGDPQHPSAPGQPPHRVSGKEQSNVDFAPAVIDGTQVHGSYGERENVAYALRNEFGFVGTDALGRNIDQAPRPAFRPVLLRNRDSIVRIIASQK